MDKRIQIFITVVRETRIEEKLSPHPWWPPALFPAYHRRCLLFLSSLFGGGDKAHYLLFLFLFFRAAQICLPPLLLRRRHSSWLPLLIDRWAPYPTTVVILSKNIQEQNVKFKELQILFSFPPVTPSNFKVLGISLLRGYWREKRRGFKPK